MSFFSFEFFFSRPPTPRSTSKERKEKRKKPLSPQGDTFGLIPPVPRAMATIASVNSTECCCCLESGCDRRSGEEEDDLPPPPPPPSGPLPRGPSRAAWTVRSTSPAVKTAEETRIVRGRPMEVQSARAPPTRGEMYWSPFFCWRRDDEKEMRRREGVSEIFFFDLKKRKKEKKTREPEK